MKGTITNTNTQERRHALEQGRIERLLQDVLHELDTIEGLYTTDKKGVIRLMRWFFPRVTWELENRPLAKRVEEALELVQNRKGGQNG